MWKPPRPSPPRRNPSAIILYMRVCRVRSVLRPAPTHCQGLAKSLLYRPALWHSLCTLNSHSNSLRWVGEVRRLAVGSKRGLRETLTFCFGHERWCLCLMQRDFLSAVWSVLYYVVYYVMSLHSFMSALKIITFHQNEAGRESILLTAKLWIGCGKDRVVLVRIHFWTLTIFLEALKSVIAFLYSVKNLFQRASSTKAELKWLEDFFTSDCCISEM